MSLCQIVFHCPIWLEVCTAKCHFHHVFYSSFSFTLTSFLCPLPIFLIVPVCLSFHWHHLFFGVNFTASVLTRFPKIWSFFHMMVSMVEGGRTISPHFWFIFHLWICSTYVLLFRREQRRKCRGWPRCFWVFADCWFWPASIVFWLVLGLNGYQGFSNWLAVRFGFSYYLRPYI